MKKRPAQGIPCEVKEKYNKLRLKERIDQAMVAFLQAGKSIERIDLRCVSNLPSSQDAESSLAACAEALFRQT